MLSERLTHFDIVGTKSRLLHRTDLQKYKSINSAIQAVCQSDWWEIMFFITCELLFIFRLLNFKHTAGRLKKIVEQSETTQAKIFNCLGKRNILFKPLQF